MTFSVDDKQKIIDALVAKGARNDCPRCGNNNFGIADGFDHVHINQKANAIKFGTPTIPVITAMCTKCGFISQHAAGVLGLLSGFLDTEEKVKDAKIEDDKKND